MSNFFCIRNQIFKGINLTGGLSLCEVYREFNFSNASRQPKYHSGGNRLVLDS